MCDTMQAYTKKKAGWRVKYGQVIRARFLARPNRFIAHAALENGETAVCHVKNTGRCRELLVPAPPSIWKEPPTPDARPPTT